MEVILLQSWVIPTTCTDFLCESHKAFGGGKKAGVLRNWEVMAAFGVLYLEELKEIWRP